MNRLGVLATSLCTLAAGALVIVFASSTVSLTVDGQRHQVWGFAPTVAQVLTDERLTLAAEDVVTPTVDTAITSGGEIVVKFHRHLDLTIDGQSQQLDTNEATLAQALAVAGLPNYREARVHPDLDSPLPRGDVRVTITTPKAVSVTANGQTRELTTTAPDVATFVAESGPSLAAGDSFFPKGDVAITAGLNIAIGKIETTTETKDEDISFAVEESQDKSLFLGESKVLSPGKPGKIAREYTTINLDGVQFLTHVTGEKVLEPPAAKRVAKGTRVAGSSGKGIDLRREAMWERVAACESSHNWQLQDRQYYGGLQFHTGTWVANGGRDFAPRADLATREQQITVANRLYDKSGIRPWACKG